MGERFTHRLEGEVKPDATPRSENPYGDILDTLLDKIKKGKGEDLDKADFPAERYPGTVCKGPILENEFPGGDKKMDENPRVDWLDGLLDKIENDRNHLNANSTETGKDAEKSQNAKGGSYGDLKKQDGREGKEVHHMPADNINKLDRNEGPAIIMDAKDHKQTASFGNSKEAQAYRAKQAELIKEGKFREAFEMDVADIQEKFGDKYDDAIAEAREYMDKLESEGKI